MYYYNQKMELDEKVVRESTWYKNIVTNNNKIRLFGNKKNMQASENMGFDGTSITASISPGKNGRFYDDIELILFVFPDSVLQQYLQSQVSKSGELIILNESGSMLASGNQSFANKGFEDDGLLEAKRNPSGHYITSINGQDVFVVYLTSNQGWKYIRIIPYDRFMKKINAVNQKSLVVGLVGIAAFLFVSYFIVQSIVRPVLSIARQMKVMKTGHFEVQIEERGPFEVYVLGKTFNEMVLRMKELIEEIGQKERQKKDAEITALQSQINPHFLLNTLNTIKLMAIISKAKHIQQMTESLTKILSSSFNRGGMYITIREEMELLEHYFTIMKIRYGDTFDVVIQIDSCIENFYILKLLLQPVVENSIIHGIQQSEKRGLIEITGELAGADFIRILIKDNGIGFADLSGGDMTDAALVHKSERFNGIGLSNVHDRIYLNYGPQYGMHIESKPGEGTTITLQLPVLQEPLRSRIKEGNHIA
jgi:two-component system sensor histidine kinase YesM